MHLAKVLLVCLAGIAVAQPFIRSKRFLKIGEAYQHKVVPQRSILYLVPEPVYVPVRVPAPAPVDVSYAPANPQPMPAYSPPQQPYTPSMPAPPSYGAASYAMPPSPPPSYASPMPYMQSNPSIPYPMPTSY